MTGGATLRVRSDFHAAERASFAALMQAVFEADLGRSDGRPLWQPFGCFDTGGRCVAGALFAAIDLACGREPPGAPSPIVHAIGALRMVAVAEDHRGQGLFRAVMEHALCHAAGLEPVLLYAENPALYRRFGFAPLAQSAFVGAAPVAQAAAPARILDPARDAALIRRLLAGRAPVSDRVAVIGVDDLFLARIADDSDLTLAHLPDANALAVCEPAGETLHLVDVVAASMPSLARILGSLPRSFSRVKTLFPPDRLGWRGEPVAEDTGLMARGRLPPAMRQPFMLPPTTEF